MKTALRIFSLLLLPFAATFQIFVEHATAEENVPLPSATAWPQADALFRKDANWVGGDDASSVDLGNGRIAWLFADSFIDPTGKHARPGAKMVRNSIGIQQGANPATASIKFYWKSTNGQPSSFFAETKSEWYWPGGGTVVDGRLVIFLMRVQRVEGGLGFEVIGSAVTLNDNPTDEPNDWRVKMIQLPANAQRVILGSACAFVDDGHLYAFGSTEPGKHDVYVTRWPVANIARGEMNDPQWWTGETGGWVAQSKLQSPASVCFAEGQTEFTVHYSKRFQRYLEFQTTGFGAAVISMRSASKITSPWSKLQTIYVPPEKEISRVMIYAAKAHPELEGAEVVLTYATNSFDFGAMVKNQQLYYPRFVRLNFPR